VVTNRLLAEDGTLMQAKLTGKETLEIQIRDGQRNEALRNEQRGWKERGATRHPFRRAFSSGTTAPKMPELN